MVNNSDIGIVLTFKCYDARARELIHISIIAPIHGQRRCVMLKVISRSLLRKNAVQKAGTKRIPIGPKRLHLEHRPQLLCAHWNCHSPGDSANLLHGKHMAHTNPSAELTPVDVGDDANSVLWGERGDGRRRL